MKNIFLILTFLLIFNNIFSQLNNFKIPVLNENYLKSDILLNDTSIYNRNLISWDFDLLAVSFAYARKIKTSNWYIGGRAGQGISYLSIFCGNNFPNTISLNNGSLFYSSINKFMHAEIFCNYMFSEKILFDWGIQLTFSQDNPENQFVLLGGYFSPMFGWRKFKIGTCIIISIFGGPIAFYSPILLFRYFI